MDRAADPLLNARALVLAPSKTIAFVVMVVALVVAPFFTYPLFLMQAMCFALFACAFNLLIGYVGLLSFGHALFGCQGGQQPERVSRVKSRFRSCQPARAPVGSASSTDSFQPTGEVVMNRTVLSLALVAALVGGFTADGRARQATSASASRAPPGTTRTPKAGCKEDFQTAKDACIDRDRDCVEACREVRAECATPPASTPRSRRATRRATMRSPTAS